MGYLKWPICLCTSSWLKGKTTFQHMQQQFWRKTWSKWLKEKHDQSGYKKAMTKMVTRKAWPKGLQSFLVASAPGHKGGWKIYIYMCVCVCVFGVCACEGGGYIGVVLGHSISNMIFLSLPVHLNNWTYFPCPAMKLLHHFVAHGLCKWTRLA